MAVIKIARLTKKSLSGSLRFCNIHLSQNTKNGDFFVSTHTGITLENLKASQPKGFRYEHKAEEFFNKQIKAKAEIGFTYIETKSLLDDFLSIEELAFSYYSYLSKTQFKCMTNTSDDLYFKPSPKAERILLQIDVFEGVKAKTLRKTQLELPPRLTKLLVDTVRAKKITNCYLDAYYDGRTIFVLDVIAVEHKLVDLNTLERHSWIEQNLYKKQSQTLKVLPCFTSKQYKNNKANTKLFSTVVLHTYKLESRPLPLKSQADSKLMWLTCIPAQIKFIVLSNRGGFISLGHTKDGYTEEYTTMPEVNYSFNSLDIVSVAVCEKTYTPIQIIGRLKDSTFNDCTHHKIQLVKKQTN